MDPEALVDAVRRTGHGESILSERIADRLAHVEQDELTTQSPFAALSPRELDVLRLIALGRTNGDIAAALVRSENTI